MLVLLPPGLPVPRGPGAGKGRPFSPDAEEFANALVGMGVSDRRSAKICALAARLICKDCGAQTPGRSYFQERRPQGGIHATAHAWCQILWADQVCQLGFDEIQINRIPHLDVWATLKDRDGSLKKVVLTSGTVLVGGLADDITKALFSVCSAAPSS